MRVRDFNGNEVLDLIKRNSNEHQDHHTYQILTKPIPLTNRCRAPRIEATGGIPAMAGASIQMGAAQVENLSEPNLHQKGMQMHEAQELALAEWIDSPTERPGP